MRYDFLNLDELNWILIPFIYIIVYAFHDSRVLFGVPRTRLDLLPFYARLVATLHPVVPEVAQDLCHMLKQDFMYHVCKKVRLLYIYIVAMHFNVLVAHFIYPHVFLSVHVKDQINIESKIKVVRFIGELVKFKMYALIEGLFCLKVLLHDFTHHHVSYKICSAITSVYFI